MRQLALTEVERFIEDEARRQAEERKRQKAIDRKNALEIERGMRESIHRMNGGDEEEVERYQLRKHFGEW